MLAGVRLEWQATGLRVTGTDLDLLVQAGVQVVKAADGVAVALPGHTGGLLHERALVSHASRA